jgi:UDP-N-acetylmuramyl pentapeptide synthase
MDDRRRRVERRLKRIRRLTSEYLGLLARVKLRRSHEQLIGITGSVGKSSTKEAITRVLESRFTVEASTPDYNTRLGLLLSIFGQRSGEGSGKAWLRAMAGATRHFLTDHNRYDKLVLEMGASWPGGMTDTLRVFRPEIAVFTGVAPIHLAEGQFRDEEAIFAEKAKLVRSMKRGTAILNRDDPYCRRLEDEHLRARVIWYGRLPAGQAVGSLPAGLYFDQVKASSDGLEADLHLTGTDDLQAASHKLVCPVLGKHHIYVLLPAVLTGLVAGLDLEQACETLSSFSLPPGRMNLIAGINSSTIIDSSRNASPKAVEAALETLRDYPAQRRIAVLGSILELGDATESTHRAIGQITAHHSQMLITVGQEATLIAEGAKARGMAEHLIQSFDTPEEAGLYLKDTVRQGDVLLVKGSRRTNLERAIELFMRDPDQADDLLFQQ